MTITFQNDFYSIQYALNSILCGFLQVMIYLVDHVLPESYFANNLRALSVDMAVFRDLLRMQLPQLSKHLDHLQAAARDDTTGTAPGIGAF